MRDATSGSVVLFPGLDTHTLEWKGQTTACIWPFLLIKCLQLIRRITTPLKIYKIMPILTPENRGFLFS
jgi:hypothetical protein